MGHVLYGHDRTDDTTGGCDVDVRKRSRHSPSSKRESRHGESLSLDTVFPPANPPSVRNLAYLCAERLAGTQVNRLNSFRRLRAALLSCRAECSRLTSGLGQMNAPELSRCWAYRHELSQAVA